MQSDSQQIEIQAKRDLKRGTVELRYGKKTSGASLRVCLAMLWLAATKGLCMRTQAAHLDSRSVSGWLLTAEIAGLTFCYRITTNHIVNVSDSATRSRALFKIRWRFTKFGGNEMGCYD